MSTDEKSKALDEELYPDDAASGLPSYEAASRRDRPSRETNPYPTTYRDNPDVKASRGTNFGSGADVNHFSGAGPSRTSSPLFRGWGSKSAAVASLTSLYKDIIQHPSSATKDVFTKICMTCVEGRIPLETITQKIDDHYPIFWMVINEQKMQGCITVFLAQKHELVRPRRRDLLDARAACLVSDSLESYRRIGACLQCHSGGHVSLYNEQDVIEIIKTEAPTLGFIANIKFADFSARYRVKDRLAMSFPARHREWLLHLGPSALPDQCLGHSSASLDKSSKFAEVILQNGEPLSCSARFRMRHPLCSAESDWLDLGPLRPVPQNTQLSLPFKVDFSGVCGPVALNKSLDWRALEFGETTFIDGYGALSLQLQVVAKNANASESRGECILQ